MASDPPTPTLAPEPAAAWSMTEIDAVWRHPDRTFEIVLACPDRLAATIAGGRQLLPLLRVLLACTVLATLPYGLVMGLHAVWKLGALYGGSVLLCWPSLQVFASFLGHRVHPAQSLALALVMSSVAALFTLGFVPIQWFLGVTMTAGDRITSADTSAVMLTGAGIAGLLQVWRGTRRAPQQVHPALLVWQLLVVFVTLRMARVLGLPG
jgi:hypothetical protein